MEPFDDARDQNCSPNPDESRLTRRRAGHPPKHARVPSLAVYSGSVANPSLEERGLKQSAGEQSERLPEVVALPLSFASRSCPNPSGNHCGGNRKSVTMVLTQTSFVASFSRRHHGEREPRMWV